MRPEDLHNLRSADPEVRRRAIIALGRSKDPSALGELANIYRNDPDPALRELAKKAGRYIQSNQTNAPTAGAPPEPLSVAATHHESHVSAATAEHARGYVDRAVDYQVRGDDVKAVEMLAKAFEINPDLRHDTFALNLAMDITGLGSSAAVATITDPARRYELVQRVMGVDLDAGRRTTAEPATWNSALIDLGIYGLVNGAIVFVVSVVATDILFRLMQAAMRSAPSASSANSMALLAEINTQQVSLPLAGLYGILSGVAAVISLLIIDGAIHVVATSVLGGQGTLAGLVRKTTLYYTALTAISIVLNVVYAALTLNASQSTASSLSVVPFVVSLGMAIWAGKLTGDAYDFGAAKGCVSMALGYFVLVALFFCCFFTLGLALAPTLQAVPR